MGDGYMWMSYKVLGVVIVSFIVCLPYLFIIDIGGGTGIVSGGVSFTDIASWMPISIYNSSTNKTFVCYASGGSYYPYVNSYNHSTTSWSGGVQAGNHACDPGHTGTVMCIDQSGYIHVFYGAHNSDLYQSVSTNPLDISSWNMAAATLSDTVTYANPLLLDNGLIALAYRSSGDQAIIMYNPSNDTWVMSTKKVLVDLDDDTHDYCYCLGGFFYEQPANILQLSIYYDTNYGGGSFVDPGYMYSPDYGVSWFSKNDVNITSSLPLSTSNYNSYCRIEAFENYGTLHIMPRTSVHNGVVTISYMKINSTVTAVRFARLDSGTWNITNAVTFSTGSSEYYHCRNMASNPIYVRDDTYDLIVLYNVSGTREVQQWRTINNGSSWNKIVDITSSSLNEHADLSCFTLGSSSFIFAESTGCIPGTLYLYENLTVPSGDPDPPTSYDPPALNHIGYIGGCGNQGNESVVVGTFWVNFTWNGTSCGTPTPTSYLIQIANSSSFSPVYRFVNITHLDVVHGNYCNTTFSNVTASTNKHYIHIRSWYE